MNNIFNDISEILNGFISAILIYLLYLTMIFFLIGIPILLVKEILK